MTTSQAVMVGNPATGGFVNAPSRCPRCRGALMMDWDGTHCLNCGHIVTPTMQGAAIEDSQQLGALALLKLRSIARILIEHEEAIADQQREARRFLRIAEMCDIRVPAEIANVLDLPVSGNRRLLTLGIRLEACDWCGQLKRGKHGVKVHQYSCPERPQPTEEAS